jgi:hypothetical protein
VLESNLLRETVTVELPGEIATFPLEEIKPVEKRKATQTGEEE